MPNVPHDLKYTRTHEWVRETDDHLIVGITDYAQAELGDVVFVELPPEGRVLQLGEPFGTIESVKAVSELYAPIAGEVIETNKALGAQPELVNSSPYDTGWLIKIKPTHEDLGYLLDADTYQQLIES
jgi:glycine cleavage system H protein